MPLIAGATVLTGGVGGGGGDAAATTAELWALSALATPAEFEPVTRTTSLSPTSPAVGLYVFVSAPAIGVQVPVQRLHRYAKRIGAVPDQLPVVALKVWPAFGTPEIVGRAVFLGGLAPAGGPAWTTAERWLSADTWPAPFDAITSRRSAWRRSAATGL